MNPEAIAERALEYARELVTNTGSERLKYAFADVEEFFRRGVSMAVNEVHITAPGVVIEDRREQGGAVVSDLRSVQDKANE